MACGVWGLFGATVVAFAGCKLEAQPASAAETKQTAKTVAKATDVPPALHQPRPRGPIPPERLGSEWIAATCQGLRECKNRDLSGRVALVLNMFISPSIDPFSGLAESPYLNGLRADLATLTEQPWNLKPESCAQLLSLALKNAGLDSESLNDLVRAEMVRYDPVAARKCATALTGAGLPACETQTEFKLETFLADAEKREARQQALRAKHSEDGRHGTDQAHDGEEVSLDEAMLALGWSMIDEALGDYWPFLETHLEACDQAIVGLGAEGAACVNIDCAEGLLCNSQMKTCQKSELSTFREYLARSHR